MEDKRQKGKKVHSNSQNADRVIAYLAPSIHDSSQPQWSGVVDAAQKHEVNLICFPGWCLNYPVDLMSQGNILYGLVTPQRVKGVISWASTIGNYATAEEIRAFHERYRPLPVLTIGKTLEGMPGLLMDSYEGMREAMVHLIEVHGYRRLAFVHGPEGHFYAQERYRAYAETLEAYGIPLDAKLITPHHHWSFFDGMEAMRLLLDERKLRPQLDFEAVVAANDHLLLGALEVLRERGIAVPEEVAVAGFDDTLPGQTNTPPLTSVAVPFYEVGYESVETMLAMLEGKHAPKETVIPSRLVIRQSCGCLSPAIAQIVTGSVGARKETLKSALDARRAGMVSEMRREVGNALGKACDEWAERLLEGFAAELEGESSGVFLRELDEALGQAAAAGEDVSAWQAALSALRRQVSACLDEAGLLHAMDVWEQARVMIGEAAQRQQANRSMQAEQQAQAVQEIGMTLITTFDLDRLMDMLAKGLPALGIPSCYLALYEDPQPYEYPQPAPEWSRLVLAYTEKGRVDLEAGGVRFRSCELLPEEMWPGGRHFCFVAEPLYVQEVPLGFALFELGSRVGAVYDALRVQISSALQGALLVQRLRNRSAELSRQQYILDTFMETVPDRIYFKDREGHITRANKAHAVKLGLNDPAEEIGKSDFDFFPAELAQAKYEQEQEIMRSGQPMMGIEERDRVGQWAFTTKMPLRDEHGDIIGTFGISRDITQMKQAQAALEQAYAEVEKQIQERTAQLQREVAGRERVQEENLRLQKEIIEAQRQALQELSTPIIPVLERVIVMPLIGSIDTMRAKDITRALLVGIQQHRARVVILDITGVPVVDTGVAAYLNKTIHAARLKGARTVVTGVSDAVAETIIELGIDWSDIETVSDLQTGLWTVMAEMARRRERSTTTR